MKLLHLSFLPVHHQPVPWQQLTSPHIDHIPVDTDKTEYGSYQSRELTHGLPRTSQTLLSEKQQDTNN